MTRNETTTSPATYDDDFFVWTQQQAAALRLTLDAIGGSVDVEHVAEEIEDLGKRDLREVGTFLERVIEHLLKLHAFPDSREHSHWASEVVNFQISAVSAFTPGMRQLLDIDTIWARGCKRSSAALRGRAAATPAASSPFALSELLSRDFDIDAALAKLAATRDTPRA